MMVRPIARSILAAFACAVFGLAVSGAAAQDGFPAKPIKLMVPLAAGGGIDFTARTTAQKLSARLPTATPCSIIRCRAW
jgi:tripartite-type tricarboxylate transporter receptor subunit TctC